MFIIFRIGNDESIMGRFTSPRWVNVFGWIATALMGAGAIALFSLLALGK
jgi:Mn2+/Fe2+ NRAMP family transporter